MADFGDLAGPGITGQIIRRLLQVEGPKTIAQIHKAVKSHYRFLELPSKAPTYKSTERYVKTLVQLGLVRCDVHVTVRRVERPVFRGVKQIPETPLRLAFDGDE